MTADKYAKNRRWNERNKERVAANKRRYRLTDEYKAKQEERRKNYGNKIKNELTDKYVVGLIINGDKVPYRVRQGIYNNKALLNCKRKQVILKRLIKTIQNENSRLNKSTC